MTASPTWHRFAPALFIFIWASGYVVAKVAAPHAEPLSFLLLRYLGVFVLMGALALHARSAWPSRRQTLHLAISGIGIQAGYLGCVWVAIKQGMPAGVAALVVNLQPVLTAALAVLVLERVSRQQWLGVLLGFGGVVLVVWHKLNTAGLAMLPVLLCVLALATMTAGTLYQKRFAPQFDLRTGQVVQCLASMAITLPFALALESFSFTWNLPLALAMLWSVLVLSGGGTSLMFMLLRDGKATTVTSYMYIVPSVTALMAWLMFNETLGPTAVLGMAVSLLGVYWVVKK